MEVLNELVEIWSNDIPAVFDKISIETIWPWCLVRRKLFNYCINFLFGERLVKINEFWHLLNKIF